MNTMEQTLLQIISAVGIARSNYIEAIKAAQKGDFESAYKLCQEAKEVFIQGHEAHATLLTKEANGERVDGGMLLIHAEDQLMSAEDFGILAEEFITTLKQIYDLKHQIGENAHETK